MKKITSIPGLFGTITHYDEQGKKIGSSVKGNFKTDHYDAKGRKVGSTFKGPFHLPRCLIMVDKMMEEILGA